MNASPRIIFILKALGLLSFIVMSWVVAIAVMRNTDIFDVPTADLATLIFGASSLFLFVFSFGLGLLSLVSWQAVNVRMRDLAGQAAQEAADVRSRRVENEMRGRAYSTIGYLNGEMSLAYEENSIKVIDKERLSEAVATLQQGYEFMSRIKDEKAEYMVLNNLVFYSLMDGNRERSKFLLEKAEDLIKVGRKHDAINLMLTASGVVVTYGVDKAEGDEIVRFLESIRNDSRLSSKRRVEVRYYLTIASLRRTQITTETV